MKKIRLKRSYYASLCWYVLNELGFTGKKTNKKNSYWIDWKEKLEKLGQEFGFNSPVAGGPMFEILYQMPSYINPKNQSELESVKDSIIAYISSNSLSCFHDKWHRKTKYWDNWFDIELKETKNTNKLVEIFYRLINEIWDQYKELYLTKLEEFLFEDYERKCNRKNIFKKWEDALEVKYPYDNFDIIICPEIPSLASSVGPDTIVFGIIKGKNEIVPSAIHEIGVRYSNLNYLKIYNKTKNIMRNDYKNFLKIIEAETCYQKVRIFPEINEDKFLNSSWKEIFEWREKMNFNFDNYYDHLVNMYTRAKKVGLI